MPGRIFGADDSRSDLNTWSEAAVAARRLSDGWFWFASLIEYVELCYRAWVATGHRNFERRLTARRMTSAEACRNTSSPTLRAAGS